MEWHDHIQRIDPYRIDRKAVEYESITQSSSKSTLFLTATCSKRNRCSCLMKDRLCPHKTTSKMIFKAVHWATTTADSLTHRQGYASVAFFSRCWHARQAGGSTYTGGKTNVRLNCFTCRSYFIRISLLHMRKTRRKWVPSNAAFTFVHNTAYNENF
jgi:hypothetical protein